VSGIIDRQPSLSKLILNLKNCYKVGNEGMKAITKSITNKTRLETLNLNYSRCEHLTEESMDYLKQALQEHKMLKTLLLIFTKRRKIFDSGFEMLCHGLAELKELRELTLNISRWNKITTTGFAHFKELLSSLQNLQLLELSCRSNRFILGEGSIFLGEGLSTLVNLKTLRLDLSKTLIGDLKFEQVFQGISRLVNLEQFDIHLHDCRKITNICLMHLFQAIGKLSRLISLGVDLSCNVLNKNITHSGLFWIYNEVAKLPKLETFTLYCCAFAYGNKDFYNMVKAVTSNCRAACINPIAYDRKSTRLNSSH